jgi:hypothetical protein
MSQRETHGDIQSYPSDPIVNPRSASPSILYRHSILNIDNVKDIIRGGIASLSLDDLLESPP